MLQANTSMPTGKKTVEITTNQPSQEHGSIILKMEKITILLLIFMKKTQHQTEIHKTLNIPYFSIK